MNLVTFGGTRIGTLIGGLSACFASIAFAQIDPDPRIFDAGQNGAGASGEQTAANSGLGSMGGSTTVVDESALPPLGTIDIDAVGNGRGSGRRPGSGSQSQVTMSTSSSGGMIPIFGGGSSGGQQEGQSTPFPPKTQSSEGQQQSQGQQGMPPGSQQMPENMEGSPGSQQQQQAQKMPKGAQSGQGPASKGKMPEPPPDMEIGDSSQQIDPNGQMSQGSNSDGEYGEAEGEADESGDGKSKGKGGESEGGKQGASDGQDMPDDMGGRQSNQRGRGTIDDIAVPSNL